jgi:predicted DNA-binding transcriptional regulator YafY
LFAVNSRGSTRIDRLDVLARVLRDRPGITVCQLADELGVSMRSVFRDLGTLRDRGLPVESARGRGGGMRLRGNWGLGRVLLSREEALCTLLGLVVAERLGLPMFSSEMGRARRKIADAFPSVERRRLAPLRERVYVGQPASSAVRSSYREPDAAVMQRLQVAFVESRTILGIYVRNDGHRSTRRLEPHALVINSPAWYLLARDVERTSTRTFRLDRFVDVQPEMSTFASMAPQMVREALESQGVVLVRV